METLADLHAQGSNFCTPILQLRMENKCVSMHCYVSLVHQICATGDIRIGTLSIAASVCSHSYIDFHYSTWR